MSEVPRTDRYHHGFSARNRVGRALWKIIEGTAFRFSPPFLHGWRRMLLRLFGAQVHSRAVIYPTVRVWAPWNLTMESDACLSWNVDCYCVARITLREKAVVSQHAKLISASHDIRDPKFRLMHNPIEVGPHAWVCAYAFVGMGVTVGEGSVVAATATVVRDVAPWSVVGGNPAKQIGIRRLKEK